MYCNELDERVDIVPESTTELFRTPDSPLWIFTKRSKCYEPISRIRACTSLDYNSLDYR